MDPGGLFQDIFLKQLPENLIGVVPRTDNAGHFAGDILAGATNPNGVLGQLGRAFLATAAFSKSPTAGIAVIDSFRRDDLQRAAEQGRAAAEGLSPQEATQRFGRNYNNLPTTPIAQDAAPGGPSLPERKNAVSFPTSPEEMDKVLQAQGIQRRLGAVLGGQATTSQSGDFAQQMGLPRSNTEIADQVAWDAQVGSIDQGRQRVSTHFSAGGPQVSITDLPFDQQLHTMDEINSSSLAPQVGRSLLHVDDNGPGGAARYLVHYSSNPTDKPGFFEKIFNDYKNNPAFGGDTRKAFMALREDMAASKQVARQPLPASKGEFVQRLAAEEGDLSIEEQLQAQNIFQQAQKAADPLTELLPPEKRPPSFEQNLLALKGRIRARRMRETSPINPEAAKPAKPQFNPAQDAGQLSSDFLQRVRAGETQKAVKQLTSFLRQQNIDDRQKMDLAAQILSDAKVPQFLPEVLDGLGIQIPNSPSAMVPGGRRGDAEGRSFIDPTGEMYRQGVEADKARIRARMEQARTRPSPTPYW